jgi:hypothetical protein
MTVVSMVTVPLVTDSGGDSGCDSGVTAVTVMTCDSDHNDGHWSLTVVVSGGRWR